MPNLFPAPGALRMSLFACAFVLGCTRGTTAGPGSAPSASATAAPAAEPPADRIPPHDSFTVQSAAVGEARPINVYTPRKYRAAAVGQREPLPVLYMPDGALNEDFPHVANTVDSLIERGAMRPVILVGIPNTVRRRDLTGPTRIASDSAVAPRVGGSAAFRRFVRDELFPEVERRYRTTAERGIIGESFAGLFVVETFLQEPALFTHYVAFDPSVWWNAGTLVDTARPLVAAMDAKPRTLFLATSVEPSTAVGSAKLAALLRDAAPRGLRLTHEPHANLTHANIFRTLKPAALVGAFR